MTNNCPFFSQSTKILIEAVCGNSLFGKYADCVLFHIRCWSYQQNAEERNFGFDENEKKCSANLVLQYSLYCLFIAHPVIAITLQLNVKMR